jgi:hypothetical protein
VCVRDTDLACDPSSIVFVFSIKLAFVSVFTDHGVISVYCDFVYEHV